MSRKHYTPGSMGFLRAVAWLLYQSFQIVFLGLFGPLHALRRGRNGFRHYLPTLRGRATLDARPKAPEPSPETCNPETCNPETCSPGTCNPGTHNPRTSPQPVWIHAVSVGEVGVAATLAARLPESLPLVITTITPTGQAHANRLFGGKAFQGRQVDTAYLPFDLTLTLRRFLRRFRPRAVILTEGDYWPLMLSILRARNTPVAVINGRISDRAFRRQQRLGRLNDLFYAPVHCFGMQTEQDRQRLIALGADGPRVHVTGNLKFDSRPPAPLPDLEQQLLTLAAGRPILVAGSTMEGEDALVIEAFDRAGGADSALLVLVPRHPERWDRVGRLLTEQGRNAVRRSAFDPNPPDRADVVLLDSLGELASLYRIAAAAFIGGTLVPTGGHNPLEPALFGTPTVVGPSMFNFQEMADSFDQADAWGRAADGAELGRIWRSWLDQPELGKAVGQRALALLETNRGALDRSLAMLLPLVEET